MNRTHLPSHRRRSPIGALLAVGAACLAVAGCGGSSGSADSLLTQTFCGTHHVNSGNLDVALKIVPSGSRTLTTPISLSLSGPFQSSGSGKLPQSDLTIGLGAFGYSIAAGVISTGTHGYVTLTGSSYQLPQSSYQKLESSFSAFSSPPGCSSKSGVLSQLHIHPLRWLTNPQIAGTENVAGASTTHIHAQINVSALLSDLGTFLKKSPVAGTGLSSSTLGSIANQIHNATFDLWTGTSDKTLRKLSINLTIPVTGQFSTLLGGLRSAAVTLSMQYGDLNQPQTISAPTNLQPYSQLKTKLSALVSAVRSQLTSALTGGLTGSGSSGTSTGTTSTATTGGSTSLQKYSACIQGANGNVAKMQKCQPLLSGG